jgi:hypothetical protein
MPDRETGFVKSLRRLVLLTIFDFLAWEKAMGLWNFLFGGGNSGSRNGSAPPELTEGDGGFGRDVVNIPSRNFYGISSKSSNGRFTIAWMDGGPDQSRRGRYVFLDRGKLVAEGRMSRPNDGKVANNGVFILNDWGAIETLSGTLIAFRPDGTPILSRKFKANLFNNGLSADGRWAVCQTANAPSDDSGRLFVFDLVAGKEVSSWQAESGWANVYEFSSDGTTIYLGYVDGTKFAYSVNGEFIDRTMWLTVGLQKGNLLIVETLLSECDNRPTHQLTDLVLPAIDRALAATRNEDVRAHARALRLRGICFESIGEIGQALTAYEQALSRDPKSGVKRKAGQLRRSLETK